MTAGAILTARDVRADVDVSCDVCVVGSGAGGAVLAAGLVEAGLDIVMLEAGGHHTKADFDLQEAHAYPDLYQERGARATADVAITVLQGRNVGGSTVHNLCYSFRTPAPILRLWREEHALPELTEAALEPSFRRVEQNLAVQQILEAEVNALNRVIRAGAEKLGFSGFVTKHNRKGCIGAGYCILGCSYDAKQSMLVTYVPKADAAGARIYANARAERIEVDGSGRKRVLGHIVGHAGETYGSIEVEAPVVVLAAGAIASPDLLLRSRIANLSGLVGRGLHLHPSVMLAGYVDEPIHAYRGIPQSYYIDEFIDLERDPHRGYVLMPIAGFPVLTATQLPGFGREHFRTMRDFSKMVGLLALLHDRSEGSVTPGSSPAKPRIDYALTEDDRRQLSESLVHIARVLFAGGASRVVAPYWKDPIELGPGDDLSILASRGVREGEIALASTHPQSTCRMGGDRRHAVVDAFGECHDVPGLFVADMSVFPTSLGAPPQITTAALADRTAHHILARWPRAGA